MAKSRTRVKICGVTTTSDALLAANAGADAVGLNFHPPSPRAVDLATAAEIAAVLPPFVATVGIFVDATPAAVAETLQAVRLDSLQFCGDEPSAFCRSFGVPYIKAAGMYEGFDFDAFSHRYSDASALLLDTFSPDLKGGTGRTFDWHAWPRSERLLVLAGGLDADNVADAIATTRPYAVDVASGVEGPVKGRKDARRLMRFFAAVAHA